MAHQYWQEEHATAVAAYLHKNNIPVTADSIAKAAVMCLGQAMTQHDVSHYRLTKVQTMIRALDAAEASRKAQAISDAASGVGRGVKDSGTLDLLIKGIVRNEVQALEGPILVGVRQLLASQLESFKEEIRASEARMMAAWGLTPVAAEKPTSRSDLSEKQEPARPAKKLKKILVWGPKRHQRVHVEEALEAIGLNEVAELDFRTSEESVLTIPRGFDYAVYMGLFISKEERKDLANHAADVRQCAGAVSSLIEELKKVLIEIQIQELEKQAGLSKAK